MFKKPKLAIIVPCYNEEAIIIKSVQNLNSYLSSLVGVGKVATDSYIVYINDGSIDNTQSLLKEAKTSNIKIIKLSTNKGHQYALLAGLQYTHNRSDCTVSIDADLQQDVYSIGKMIDAYLSGAHIVYGTRNDKYSESYFKKSTTKLFYIIMRLFGVPLVKGHADFRLLSYQAVTALLEYKERNLFLRGIFPLINLKTAIVEYNQTGRQAGRSQYTFKKMLSLAINGITSFSNVPIRMITCVGLLLFLITMVLSINVLVVYIKGKVIPGWASITLPLYFLGGIQLLSLGVLGEYIARIYKETKQRPYFHIEEIIE